MSRTYDALHRAEKNYARKRLPESQYENIESLLVELGLGEEHILKQNYGQLKQSYNRINLFIERPQSFFKLQTEKKTLSKIPDCQILQKVLLIRKKHILGCFDKLITDKKLKIINQLAKKICDSQIRLAIEKILKDLQVKNDLLMKEYEKIVHLEKKLYEKIQIRAI
jgi:hypothetical protein